ncbi:MAG TPA: DUF3467 domain-containing protein [Anaerolineales bacterium]|nr:DUF3467 domain-containing protein [Anaerolineales bacterium]
MTNPTFRVAQQLPLIEVPEGMGAAYANVVRIAHMPTEMVFDFALKLPGTDPAMVTARVMMSPLSAKLFHRALTENIAKYEKLFGEIRIPGFDHLEDYSKLFRPPPGAEPEPDPEKPPEDE